MLLVRRQGWFLGAFMRRLHGPQPLRATPPGASRGPRDGLAFFVLRVNFFVRRRMDFVRRFRDGFTNHRWVTFPSPIFCW